MITQKRTTRVACIFLLGIVSGRTFGMEPEAARQPVVEADLFIIPNPIYYAGFTGDAKRRFELVSGTKLQPNDVLVHVCITSRDCDKFTTDYPERLVSFPDHLPLFLFDGKHEGDFVDLLIDEKAIRLRCWQLGYNYKCLGCFEKALNELKEGFVKSPIFETNFTCDHVEAEGPLFEKAGILERVVDDETGQPCFNMYRRPIFKHGLKDFRWLNERKRNRIERAPSWLMAGHPRLGAASPANNLPLNLLRYIFELSENNSR